VGQQSENLLGRVAREIKCSKSIETANNNRRNGDDKGSPSDDEKKD